MALESICRCAASIIDLQVPARPGSLLHGELVLQRLLSLAAGAAEPRPTSGLRSATRLVVAGDAELSRRFQAEVAEHLQQRCASSNCRATTCRCRPRRRPADGEGRTEQRRTRVTTEHSETVGQAMAGSSGKRCQPWDLRASADVLKGGTARPGLHARHRAGRSASPRACRRGCGVWRRLPPRGPTGYNPPLSARTARGPPASKERDPTGAFGVQASSTTTCDSRSFARRLRRGLPTAAKPSANPFDDIAWRGPAPVPRGIASEVVATIEPAADAQAHLRNGLAGARTAPSTYSASSEAIQPLTAARALLKLVERNGRRSSSSANRPSTTTAARPARCSPRCGSPAGDLSPPRWRWNGAVARASARWMPGLETIEGVDPRPAVVTHRPAASQPEPRFRQAAGHRGEGQDCCWRRCSCGRSSAVASGDT